MLIDTREHTPQQPDTGAARPVVEPDWRLWGWFSVALALLVASSMAPPLPGLALVVAGICAGWRTLEVFTDTKHGGMRAWRQ